MSQKRRVFLEAVRMPASVMLVASTACPALFGSDSLTLRVNDAIGEPGGVVAVVIRTYAPRGIGQGQICLGAGYRQGELASGELGTPFASLLGLRVFSERNDAFGQAFLEETEARPTAVIRFSSPSGTINSSDGPLAVLYFRLRSHLQPDWEFDLGIGEENTFLKTEKGEEIPFTARSGRLRIRHPEDPYRLAAEGAEARPGELTTIAIETREPRGVVAAQIAVQFDASVVSGVPAVDIDPRYGNTIFMVDVSMPGLVVVRLESDGSLNLVPGELIRIALTVSPSAEPGTEASVYIDPGLTYLIDAGGALIPLRLEEAVLKVR